MLDIKILREKTEELKKATADKQVDPSVVDRALELDQKWREQLKIIEELRAQKNAVAQKMKASLGDDERKNLIEKGKELKEKAKIEEDRFSELETKRDDALKLIPNPAKEDVKPGKDDTENEVIKTWGKPRNFDFEPKDHLELGESLGLIDVESARKTSGARFAYLKGDAVRLEFALVQYAMEILTEAGFVPVIPPVLIKKQTMEGMGYLEHGGEDDMYVLEKDELVLVGTSEQSIGPMHMDETIPASSLPLRYVGYSPCFRREAGSYGKDTRGILRVHQFDKVEMFSFTHPDKSEEEHEFLLSIEEKLFQGLEIPYQVIKMVTGDLGAPAARKYDIEAWIPTQGKYREVTSTSTTTDFQARRLNVKYQEKDNVDYLHMLNGTAFAIGRTIITILENYQKKDGSVLVPEALQKYMGKETIS